MPCAAPLHLAGNFHGNFSAKFPNCNVPISGEIFECPLMPVPPLHAAILAQNLQIAIWPKFFDLAFLAVLA